MKNQKQIPTVAQQFVATLKEIGATCVFGVPSGSMIDFIEAIRVEEGIEFITVGHEATAAIMADVYGRLTGKPGICFGTFGPGATNLSSGVGGALLDRSPMIAFTDEMPDPLLKRTVQMNIDHQALFRPITKFTARLGQNNVGELIKKAASVAMSGQPGSVHIGVPAGIGPLPCNEASLPGENLPTQTNPVDEKELEKFKEAFSKARKPLMAIGLSAVRAGASPMVKKIAEKFGIPVVLTPMAKGMVPENHPLYVGVLSHALANMVAETYSQADLIIGLGYDPIEFNYEEWAPNVPVVNIDNVPADIDLEKYTLAAELVGDLNTILERVVGFHAKGNSWDLETVKQRKNKMFEALTPSKNSWGPRAVVDGLRKALPDNGILTVDVGAHLHMVGQKWLTPAPEKLIMTNGWSSMGFAIPAALAAKLVSPELPVACLLGDGCFLMTVGELATARYLNLPIVFVVIVDGSLSLIDLKQQKKGFDRTYGTKLIPQEYFSSDSYFGVPVFKVKEAGDYPKALKKAFQLNGPVVIEAHVDGEEYKNFVLKPDK